MPTSAVQLALFLALLVPGFTYRSIKNRLEPREAPGALVETTEVVLVSVAADALAIALFAVARVLLPQHTLRIGAYIRNPREYLVTHYVETLLTGATLLVIAVVIAVAFTRLLPRLAQTRAAEKLIPYPNHNLSSSAWWSVFQLDPDARTYVQCHLNDGKYVEGSLYLFSRSAAEIGDRDMVLSGRIKYRLDPCADLTEIPDGVAVLSARNISLLLVTYLEPAPALTP